MFFILDSWLDNKNPFIRVMSQETGQIILEFKGNEIQHLLEQQVIDIKDLYFRDKAQEKEMICELFLFAQHQNQSHQDELLNQVHSATPKRKRISMVTNTFNRLESLRKTFFAYSP